MSHLVGHLFELSYIGKTELLMQLDGCDVGIHDERQQRMHFFIRARQGNELTQKSSAHALALGCRIQINGGFIAPFPHTWVAVGVIPGPT